MTFSSGETRGSIAKNEVSSSGSISSTLESFHTEVDAPAVHGELIMSAAGEHSQNSNMLARSNNTNQNGIPLFQGYYSFRTTYMDFMIVDLKC